MTLLKPFGQGPSYLKAGFQGFNKSGKTYTAAKLAIGVRKFFDLKGPVAFHDTENGSDYVSAMVKKETGMDMVGNKSRSLRDLLTLGEECVSSGASVLIVDSVTHIWRELCDAYLKQVNERKRAWAEREGKKFYPKDKLEFQDQSIVKGYWEKWTNFYLNAPLHIVICGRAGYTYDFEKDEETGKKELIKTGIKMKTEGEFGFEPSLLVEMERIDTKDRTKSTIHRATIIGDRFGLIDGATADDPTWEFFKPHVAALVPGAHVPVAATNETYFELGVGGHSEARRQTIFFEKIQAEVSEMYPGQTAKEKQDRLALYDDLFGTKSLTEIENLSSEKLKIGLDKLAERKKPPTEPSKEALEAFAQ